MCVQICVVPACGFLNLSIADLFSFFFKILFIYLRERMRERESMRGGGSEGEADSPLSGGPDVGLDPGTPGS